jgi:hypothetical protein
LSQDTAATKDGKAGTERKQTLIFLDRFATKTRRDANPVERYYDRPALLKDDDPTASIDEAI